MEHIARIANVSKATVSRVVNGKTDGVGEETRLRVQQVIDEYGYVPNLAARGMATSRSKTIGLVVPDMGNPFFPELVCAVEAHLRSCGYTVMICNTSSSAAIEEQSIRELLARRMDGIILATVQEEKQKKSEPVLKLDVPCVLIDRKSNVIDYDAGVFSDNEFAFFKMTSILLSHGNRRIAFIKGPQELSATKERLQGYFSALKQRGVPIDEALLVPGNFDFRSGYEAIMSLREKGTAFSAVVSGNDMMALGAMRALEELNIAVPDEVEVAGCDNIFASGVVHPSLTTIQQPLEKIGRKAAELVLDLIAGKTVQEKNVRFEADIILRDSTRCQ